MKKFITVILIAIVTFIGTTTCTAAHIKQNISLNAGWNAVYIYVEPDKDNYTCDSIFAGIPVISVWKWNYFSPDNQFIFTPPQPDEMEYDSGQWQVYIPGNTAITNLHSISANSCYLINCEQACTLVMEGTPKPPRINWKSNSYNLVGFQVAGGGMLFDDYFNNSSSHYKKSANSFYKNVYTWEYDEIKKDYIWKTVNTTIEKIIPGKAYWIYSLNASDFVSPINIKAEFGDSLNFSEKSLMQCITIKNESLSNSFVTITPYQSGGELILDGDTSLWRQNEITQPCIPFDDPNQFEVKSGDKKTITFCIERAKIAAGDNFEGLIKLSTDNGIEQWYSTSASSVNRTGLWAGFVEISSVEHIQSTSEQSQPNMMSVASGFEFPIIMHFDENNNVTLLGEVVELWEKGEVVQDPNTGYNKVKIAGKSVLVTDTSVAEQLIDSGVYSLTSLRNGQMHGRRLSSAIFAGVKEEFELWNGVSDLEFGIDVENKYNPFIHKYHHDHKEFTDPDNPDNKAAYHISRIVKIVFTDNDPDIDETDAADKFVLGWGDSVIGGKYYETISGLQDNKIDSGIDVSGVFRLYKVSDSGILITGN